MDNRFAKIALTFTMQPLKFYKVRIELILTSQEMSV